MSAEKDARKGLKAIIEALRRERRSGMRNLPLLLLPFFAIMTIVTAYELGALAVLSLLASIAFFAGFAVHAGYRGERIARRHQHRIDAEVRRRLEDIDPTDSMFSLNYFEARLDQEVRRSKRHLLPLCVLTLEMPTGTEGWSAETARLISIAARLLRAEDTVCHIGGRGYAISLPHTTPAGAAVVINRLSQELHGEEPKFGLAYLPPGREVPSQAMIEHALRTHVRAETAAAAAIGVDGRDGEVAA